VQIISAQTTLTNNVMFNGPRAGINFLDGFGGGNLIEGNLAFNFVRETGDHGPFNSWDRQPYLTTVRLGDDEPPSLIAATSTIVRNFLINNYNSVWPIDHDDGSSFYDDHDNFLVYGGYKNYIGNSKNVHDNIYVHPEWRPDGSGRCVQDVGIGDSGNSGWDETWTSNTCIFTDTNDIGVFGDNGNDLNPPTAGDNVYMVNADAVASGDITMSFGSHKDLRLDDAQSTLDFDTGSKLVEVVSDDEIIAMGRDMLGM